MADEDNNNTTAEETQDESTDAAQEEQTADDSQEKAAAKEQPKEEEQEEAASEDTADADEGEEVEVPEQFKALVEQVESLSVLELNELVKVLEKKFGVSAAAVAAPGAGDGGGEAEKDEFDVVLNDDGGAKIPVMKAVKELLGLGLKEAKDLVEGVPSTLKEGLPKEEADEMKTKIEEAGGTVELK